MAMAKLIFLFCCIIGCLNASEELERHKRQSGLNGAHTDAMDRSRNGGFGGSYNPMITSGGFGGRPGLGYGGTVWSSGRQSLGVGAAGRADIGLYNGRPFARAPELGVGATYNRGANSFSLGVGRTFGSNPSNQVGVTFGRRFRRSLDDTDNDDDNDALEEIDETEDDNNNVVVNRSKRQTAIDQAMTNAQPNKPLGIPQFSYQVDAAGNNLRNFGASGSAGAGVRAWERGQQSVGVGVGASGNLARFNGQTFTSNPQLGVGLGYQNRGFSATVGAGRTFGRFPSNHFGVNLGYRFKRSAEDSETSSAEDNDGNLEENIIIDDLSEVENDADSHESHRSRRQAMDFASRNTLTNKGVGRPQFSYEASGAGRNFRNFGASGSVGTGVKVWERGPHSVGLGAAASADLARINGKTYTGNYQIGAGVGYHHRSGASVTLGAGRGVGQFRSKPFGAANFEYRFG